MPDEGIKYALCVEIINKIGKVEFNTEKIIERFKFLIDSIIEEGNDLRVIEMHFSYSVHLGNDKQRPSYVFISNFIKKVLHNIATTQKLVKTINTGQINNRNIEIIHENV